MENVKKVIVKEVKSNKESLIEIVSSFKSCNVIEGGNVFFGIDDCRSILRDINSEYRSKEEYDNMLESCKIMLKVISEGILFSGLNGSDENISNISLKYI